MEFFRNGKLFLICEKDESLRLVYKASLPGRNPRPGRQFRFDASLLFSNRYDADSLFPKKKPLDIYQSFEFDFSQPVTLHSEEGILLGWLTTIFTEPLTRNEQDTMIDILTSKSYDNVSFIGLETGTRFIFDREYLNQQLPIFLRKCGHKDGFL
jgi:hypothetical protein